MKKNVQLYEGCVGRAEVVSSKSHYLYERKPFYDTTYTTYTTFFYKDILKGVVGGINAKGCEVV